MTERPIIFSGPMVRAILRGDKTQTRSVMKPQPPEDCVLSVGMYAPRVVDRHGIEGPGPERFGAFTEDWDAPCPYGQPGDRLWVREKWAAVPASAYRCSEGVHQTVNPGDPDMAAVYAASWGRSKPGSWRPSIHMPRWASRITLEVLNVRPERVQDITYADILAEGWDPRTSQPVSDGTAGEDARAWFRALWDSINAKRGFGWDANPWVWRIEFSPLELGHG